MTDDGFEPHRRVPVRREGCARVVLADDHAPTRAGVRLALEGEGFEIVAEVARADEAVAEALRQRPDVCLLDLSMPGGGIAAARAIHAAVPEAEVVVLTASAREDDLFEALRAGASGYLVKTMSADRLPVVLRGVLAGEAALPRSLSRGLVEEFRARELRHGARPGLIPTASGRRAALTRREREVVELLRQQLSAKVVAQRFGISEVTVRRHISSIMRKLEVSNRASALQLLNSVDA